MPEEWCNHAVLQQCRCAHVHKPAGRIDLRTEEGHNARSEGLISFQISAEEPFPSYSATHPSGVEQNASQAILERNPMIHVKHP
jgi:hypothetical protein